MTTPLDASDLRGIFPAIPTPVTAEDAVDVAAVRHLVSHLVGGGVSGIVPLGGTGEFCSLSSDQRVRMVATCVEAADRRVPIIPGILHPGYQDALATGQAFADAGADALMLLTPYYTTPTQAGMRDYFLRFADASPIPVLLYEIPYRTRISIDPEIVHALSRHENIVGMKSSNPDLYHFLKIAAGTSQDFSILSGEDTLFPFHMAGGARGGVIVTASVLPRTWTRMYEAAAAGDHATVVAMHMKIMPLLDMAFAEVNPGPLKSAWDLLGVEAPTVLAPLVPVADDLRNRLRAELQDRLKDEAAFV